MTFYTNSNQIEEVMKQLAEVEVKPFKDLDPSTEVTVYLFGKELEMWARAPDSYWYVSGILQRCPAWGRTIMELMMKCKDVYLFFGEWRRVVFHPEILILNSNSKKIYSGHALSCTALSSASSQACHLNKGNKYFK